MKGSALHYIYICSVFFIGCCGCAISKGQEQGYSNCPVRDWTAVITRGTNSVVHLLDSGIDIDAKDANGHTMLFAITIIDSTVTVSSCSGVARSTESIWSQESKCDLLKCLLARGANQNIISSEGSTCLEQAILQGQDKVVEVLLEQSWPVKPTKETLAMAVMAAQRMKKYNLADRLKRYIAQGSSGSRTGASGHRGPQGQRTRKESTVNSD